jgi:hypothetical protein
MLLPFTPDQFLAVFAAYNLAVWPAQLVAYLLSLGMVLALLRPTRWTHRIVGAGLGLMWVWTGVAYHALFFAPINKAAHAFAALSSCKACCSRTRRCFGPSCVLPGGKAFAPGWAGR